MLRAAELEDNPVNSLDVPTKCDLLRTYQAAWSRLPQLESTERNTEIIRLAQTVENFTYELAGGVLGLLSTPTKVHFNQLGSELRGIPSKTWEIDLKMHCRDFTMDPGQDLLVVVSQKHGVNRP